MSANHDFQQMISQWDLQLREGKAQSVHAAINKLTLSKIPYHHRRDVCSLLRRIGDFEKALKVLTPNILNKDSKFLDSISDPDLAEYGTVLQKIGLYQDAIRVLSSLDSDKIPKSSLYYAFCYFGVRDYQSSLPLLRKFISSNNITQYEKTIGQVNLLAALIETNNFEEAETLADDLIALCTEKNYFRFLSNCKELKAQIAIHQNRFADAQKLLSAAMDGLEGDSGRYQLWVKKWQSFIAAKETGDVSPIRTFKEMALNNNHHEAVREADYLQLKIQFDQSTFNHLFFGSMFKSYRKKIVNEFSHVAAPPPESFTIGSAKNVLNLSLGTFNDEPALPQGLKMHQLLCALFSDLYVPLNKSMLFTMVFEDEAYNVFSSPNKIHQLVLRLRRQLKSKSIAVPILVKNQKYQIQVEDSISVCLAKDKSIPSKETFAFEKLSKEMGDKKFSRENASKVLDLSRAQSKRVLADFIEKGWITKEGVGRSTFYKIYKNINQDKVA